MNMMCLSAICMLVCIILINCRLGGVGQPNHHSDPKNFAPNNVGKFFDGSHDAGGKGSAKVAPSSHESSGLELKNMESGRLDPAADKEAQQALDQVKAQDQ